MRLPILAALLFIAPVAGCAHRAQHLVSTPPRQDAFGTPDAFGSGIVAMSTHTVTVDLTRPAHLMVVRVFEGESAQLVYPLDRAARGARDPLQPGARRLELWMARAQDQVPDLAAQRRASYRDEENACRMRRKAYEAARPRDTLNPRPPTPFWDTCESVPTQLDQQPAWTTVLGARIRPVAHYLVVIATDERVDPMAVAERLSEYDFSRESGAAAARRVPEYLLGERARWTAWVTYQP